MLASTRSSHILPAHTHNPTLSFSLPLHLSFSFCLGASSSCTLQSPTTGARNERYEQHVHPTGENDEASGANDRAEWREEKRGGNDALDALRDALLRVRRRGRIPLRSGAREALHADVICKRFGIAERKCRR